jgi:copper ion binding protein
MTRIKSTPPAKGQIVNGYAHIVTAAVLAALTPMPLLAEGDKDAPAATAKAACCDAAQAPCCAGVANAGLTKVEFQVAGMTGATCESKVKSFLAKIQGVQESSACADSTKVAVAYDSAKVRDKDLIAAIRKAGFKVAAETVELQVDGMNCADCASKVGAAIAKLKGVREQKVGHEAHNAVVTFDPQKMSRERLTAAIGATGFKVVN